MSTFDELPRSKNDREYQSYELNADKEVSLRVSGALEDSTGKELDDTLVEQTNFMISLLQQMNENLQILVGQMRYLTDVNINEGDKY